ncbi:MAG: DUF1579 family protein [Candidatus Acidiferrales bacterium]
MRKRSQFSAGLAAMLFVAGAASVQAQSTQKQTPPAQGDIEQAVAEAAQPGPIHAQLMKRAGKYTTAMLFSAPGAEPQESTGTATLKPILGGRFLEEENSGESLGEPSAGLRLYGYNNGSKQYEAIWIYTGSTACLVLDGASDDNGKTVRYTGAFIGPNGAKQTIRVIVEQQDADHFVVRLLGEGPGGATSTLATTYTRVPARPKK